MDEDKILPVIMECSASYILKENESSEITRGVSNVLLDAEKLTVLPASGEPLLIPYRDIAAVSKSNYKVEVSLVSKESLILFDLGYKYEDFARNFSNLNNEVILKDLLMNETIFKSGLEADLKFIGEDKAEQSRGLSELRIYETGLVIVSGGEDFIRVPYSDIVRVRIDNYRLVVDTEYSESYLFSGMGKELDTSYQMINDLMNKLTSKIQMSFKELFPSYDSSIIRKMARLMKEGRAARRIDVEMVSPGLWSELEKKLAELGIQEEYEYLKSIAQAERMCIGIKRGLMGDLTGEYIWFLAPVFSTDPARHGNAIAMEATAGDSSGRATYFFRITERNRYLNLRDMPELETEVDKALKILNRHLITINFRREPLYLTDEQLQSPAYISYRRAVQKVPSLGELRRRFIGRVTHHSYDQWKADISQLLESNMSKS